MEPFGFMEVGSNLILHLRQASKYSQINNIITRIVNIFLLSNFFFSPGDNFA